MTVRDGDRIIEEFHDAVNMDAETLASWLETEESRSVEQQGADDLAHMRKVVGYVRRHLAQRPSGDIEHSRWRYSLMNWGHDPLVS